MLSFRGSIRSSNKTSCGDHGSKMSNRILRSSQRFLIKKPALFNTFRREKGISTKASFAEQQTTFFAEKRLSNSTAFFKLGASRMSIKKSTWTSSTTWHMSFCMALPMETRASDRASTKYLKSANSPISRSCSLCVISEARSTRWQHRNSKNARRIIFFSPFLLHETVSFPHPTRRGHFLPA